jgi:hypothetical protein
MKKINKLMLLAIITVYGLYLRSMRSHWEKQSSRKYFSVSPFPLESMISGIEGRPEQQAQTA